MKKVAKNLVATILGYQIRKLYKKNDFKVIAVAGSIGKTSTKLAIASVLAAKYRVRSQEGNLNDLVTVPLVFFGEDTPSLFNPFAWLGVFWRNQRQLGQNYPYDFVVLELGSDAPGQIEQFKRYLKVEIGVVPSITPEHMEFFKTLNEVAKEELKLAEMSSLLLVNKDLSPEKYYKNQSNLLTYALHSSADYTPDKLKLLSGALKNKPAAHAYSILAAAVVGLKCGMDEEHILAGIQKIKPVPGRMQILAGMQNSTIIDDSYNSSPEAVKLAMQALYETNAKQRIAILGNMNELGETSAQSHSEIGQLCDPKKLNLVVTIGPDANKYLATAAEARGCKVQCFESPYEAGEFVKTTLKPKAAILVKGSQNGVFAEEAIKPLLANPADSNKLVRQEKNWLAIKQKAFKS